MYNHEISHDTEIRENRIQNGRLVAILDSEIHRLTLSDLIVDLKIAF